MGTLSNALNIATGALQADQSALDIVANNVSNANTAGYTREVPQWQENVPVNINGTNYGTGVTMTGGRSQRDRVLEQRVQQQTQTEAASNTRLTALQQVQAVFSSAATGTAGSPASGISQDLSQFFDSLAQLEGNPSDNSLRQQVLSTASSFAAALNSASTQLSEQQASLDQQTGTTVGQVNALTSSIAQLNRQIGSVGASGDTGTLEDQRQQDLQQLSQLIGIHTITTEGNGLTVTTSAGALLVSKSSAFKLSTGTVSGATNVFDASGNNITASLAGGGGQLDGMLTVRNQDIPQIQTSLDTLAYSLATSINTQNAAGSDLSGAAGAGIFSVPGTVAGSAAAINVNMTDPSKIAAAGSGLGPSDNTNATAMASLANSAIVSGATPVNYYSSFVSSLGSLVSQVSTENTAQQASLTQIQGQRNALSSVDLNEEAASLENLQRSYEAASKVFTILDTLMSSAVNLGVQTAVS
ncbi:flagellar hook-associated protein FlgK [Acidipila rosea]|uniref:Flagellar hook-associated protein 1 n=1 Tax=Acidipila rosea TaxID=768535 RepID=A0A4R1LAM3_9BACT|nr:flagellar hook-associated protein FlgK [Acidipila rosea]MBW4027594.1 flagellar hook-associated protein FlgK [Acidobacteriota bacterium]TCK75496.1 flagellar hook-associated protein 1 FlgK [Acidipila rosea]